MTRYNLDTCSMLAELNISQWTARKLDKTTTDEVVVSKNAGAKDAARVNKHLLAGRTELEVINKHVGATRTYFYDNTLPWSDSGIRLLPTSNFLVFDARMTQFADEFVQLVADFNIIYPTLITAQAMALGGMFNRNDYPSPDDIVRRFDFRVNYMPVPMAGDFRVDVGNDAQTELQAKLDKLADERVNYAMQDLTNRFKDHLERMSDRLGIDYVANDAKPRKFPETLITGGLDLCELAKTLNVINDPALEEVRVKLYNMLNGVDVKDLKQDLGFRKDTKTQVDQILDAFNF